VCTVDFGYIRPRSRALLSVRKPHNVAHSGGRQPVCQVAVPQLTVAPAAPRPQGTTVVARPRGRRVGLRCAGGSRRRSVGARCVIICAAAANRCIVDAPFARGSAAADHTAFPFGFSLLLLSSSNEPALLTKA
jgi:hypothetical protein